MMSQELLYTSAPRGLKPGSRGFCTVLSTQGMAAPLTTALEGLSGYRPVYPTGDDRADRNPVVYSHLKLQSSGRAVNVLSRIADFGLDYSQRANKLAHHVVLDRTELLPGGPANLLSMRDFMRDEWTGEPTVIALKPVKRETDPPSGVCRAWQELTGDAGWAGVLAESFLQAPDRLVVLLFAPGQNILPLFNEAISLLPVERRWDVTFSTYFTGLATGTTCTWRAIVQDSKDAHESLRFVNALRLDLTSGSLGRATGGPLVEAARSGTRPHDNSSRSSSSSRTGPSGVVFAEAEQVRVEFSSDDRTPTSFRRTVTSPQPSKQPQAQSAPPPQQPPDREPSYRMLPTEPPSTQPARPVRRLSDVIEAESQRPGFGMGTWLGLGALALAVAALLSVMFMGPAHKDDGQRDLAKNQSGQQSPDSNKTTAGKGDGPSNNPGTIIAPTPPAPKPKDAHPTVAANDRVPKNVATSPKGTDATASVSKPDGAANPSIPATPPTGEPSPPPTPPKPDPPAPPVTPAKPKIVVEYLPLPDKDKFIELHSFRRVPAPPVVPPATQPAAPPQPGMLLLKPDWLPYVDYKASPSHAAAPLNAKRSIVEKNSAEGEPPVVALFTEYEDSASDVKYRLKPIPSMYDHVPWLGWYRIRILSATPGSPPIKDIAFSPFPIGEDEATVGRQFKKFGLQWSLPASALVESTEKPQPKPKLVLDRLVIKIGGQTISLAGESREPQSAWAYSLDEFTSRALESFRDNTGPASNKLDLKMELASGKAGPEIKLQLTGAQKFLKGIEKELTASLTVAKSEVPRLFKSIYVKPKGPIEKAVTGDDPKPNPKVAEIEELLKACTAEKPIGAAKICKSLQEAKADAQEQLKGDDLKDAVQMLTKAISLYESVEKYPPLEESLSKASIVSARLYYELTGTMKDPLGETIKLTEVVDVVNFDDSKASSGRRGNRRSRNAEQLVGEGKGGSR